MKATARRSCLEVEHARILRQVEVARIGVVGDPATKEDDVTTIYIATGDALAVVGRQDGAWRADLRLVGLPTQCVASDPLRPERVYCGTFGRGLWRSGDAGTTWQPVGDGISYGEVMSVAVSRLEHVGEYGVVWAGTEPSALFRSEDGGRTWQERPSLRALPSAPTWSFPPRPWTSHVRTIAPDPLVAQRLFVGIELGGVMRSLDAGLTWEDRKPGAQPDAHTLVTHRLAPGWVYEAAGGGYAESSDGGDDWRGYDTGLAWRYLWGLAVDPADPETMVISASPGPREAHDTARAQAMLYRRTAGQLWRPVHTGLPEPTGTRAYILATNDAEPGVFYAAPHEGILYRSVDAGLTWERLEAAWPAGYRAREAAGLVVVESG
ncbi:MAG: glycosyl hydrolase [Chloroflexi bacterium]|nr:glycosyl hydrolase [Chloroflexota bacterium]